MAQRKQTIIRLIQRMSDDVEDDEIDEKVKDSGSELLDEDQLFQLKG